MHNLASTATLSEQAFQVLRGDVLSGRHAPESKLKVDALQQRYGFSSSPLREALNRLVQEGLVKADERRGFRVTPISPSDLADITKMRLMLDIPALQESISAGDDAWEAQIVAAFHRLEKIESRLPQGPVVLDAEWSQRHRDFHMALIAACPSERQLSWSMSLFDQAERYRHFAARNRTVSKKKDDEHRALMKAVLRRDGKTAAALLSEHIRSTQTNVMAAFALQQKQGA
ncbi:FCD domain-containing protein [Limnohabitans sp. Jir72]|uniref:FCD domain-containing protein n=1 Tax=Limnohabitans sp. Jir72 TaxID=1977909 RepID=UPI000D34D5FE|nr:FCD domain-containing protein [Limnohabitans sp. Jir72]PUE33370.1 GntR family transcriptional regulator [Limnohabitans sp. Jir72]